MLTAIQGIYENGQIILDEVPPVQGRTKVVVTFLDEKLPVEPKPRKADSLAGSGKEGVRLGSWEGKYSLPDDFNEPLDDLADYM